MTLAGLPSPVECGSRRGVLFGERAVCEPHQGLVGLDPAYPPGAFTAQILENKRNAIIDKNRVETLE